MWGVWALLVLVAVAYVATYATRIPILDDLEVLRLWLPTPERSWAGFWAQHNEHRIPIPRLVQVGLLGLTGDYRSGMYFTVAVYAALSGAMILAARRLRGRTTWTDAFFPLVWISIGNSDNLLMGFQLSLALPTAFVCVVLLCALGARSGLSTSAAWTVAAMLVALPLCGGPGLTQVPPLLSGAGLLGVLVLARRVAAPRAAGWVLLCGAALTVAVVALYLTGFVHSPNSSRTTDPSRVAPAAARVASLALGRSGEAWWPWSFVLVGAVVAGAAALLLARLRREPAERLRAAGILCVLAASACLSVGIGYGRGGTDAASGFAVRYIGLSAPILCAAYFAFELYARPIASEVVRGGLVLVLSVGAIVNDVPLGRQWGEERRALALGMRAAILDGRSSEEVCARYGRPAYGNAGGFLYLTGLMADHRVPPFDEVDDALRAQWHERVFVTPFERLESAGDAARVARIDEGFRALVAPADTAVYLPVTADSRRVTGRYGALRAAHEIAPADPVRILVVLLDGEHRTVLLDRVLDPSRVASDRGPQALDLALPHAGRTVAVRVLPVDRAANRAENHSATAWLAGFAVE